MGLFGFNFGFSSTRPEIGLPALFALNCSRTIFVEEDLKTIYKKILTDVAERSHGLNKDEEKTLWDSYLQSNTTNGLISILTKAMVTRSDAFIVYVPSVKVVRVATPDEEKQIKSDYKLKGESDIGVYVSFQNYTALTLVKLYSELEYLVLSNLNKTVNLSEAIQIKVAELRKSVSLADSSIASTQGTEIAEALALGKSIMIDAGDSIVTASVDTTPTEKAMTFLAEKKAFLLGMPLSYITGEQTSGIGSTGEADTRAVERGLKYYFVSIFKPVCDALYKVDLEFKTQDFRQATSALDALRTFEMVGDDILPTKSKREIIARMFDIEIDEMLESIENQDPVNETATI